MSETNGRQPSLKELAARCLGTDRRPSVNSSSKGSEKLSPLTSQLERRILAMARRWRYSDDDLADVLALARRNPEKWRSAVALDERREAEFRECNLLPRADA